VPVRVKPGSTGTGELGPTNTVVPVDIVRVGAAETTAMVPGSLVDEHPATAPSASATISAPQTTLVARSKWRGFLKGVVECLMVIFSSEVGPRQGAT
jgi:hypothetical protein